MKHIQWVCFLNRDLAVLFVAGITNWALYTSSVNFILLSCTSICRQPFHQLRRWFNFYKTVPFCDFLQFLHLIFYYKIRLKEAVIQTASQLYQFFTPHGHDRSQQLDARKYQPCSRARRSTTSLMRHVDQVQHFVARSHDFSSCFWSFCENLFLKWVIRVIGTQTAFFAHLEMQLEFHVFCVFQMPYLLLCY